MWCHLVVRGCPGAASILYLPTDQGQQPVDGQRHLELVAIDVSWVLGLIITTRLSRLRVTGQTDSVTRTTTTATTTAAATTTVTTTTTTGRMGVPPPTERDERLRGTRGMTDRDQRRL